MFLVAQGRRLAGGAAGHDAVGAALQMKLDQAVETFPIDGAVLERRDQRYHRTAEHEPISYSILTVP
ncbi:hypothetical protein D3C83_116290 [compost metagenome]